ncbi:MAG: alpha/beta hydrolase [Halopenitus sp.]
MTRRKPRNRAQQHLDWPPRERYATRDVDVESGGDTCRGTLYLPSSTENPPVVVLAPELGAERTLGLPAVAERFAANGYAAFCFDYRGFGASDGADQTVAPTRHQDDLAAAVDRLADVDAVGDETVVAGYGLGAAHAVSVAAETGDIDAVIAITPILDGQAFLRQRGRKPFLRALVAGLRGATIGRVRGDREVPIAGDVADLAPVTDKRSYLDLVDRESDWRNATPAQSLWRLARHDVTDALDDLRAPTLVLAGTDDAQAPADRVERAAERIESAASHRATVTFVEMPADHWSVYGEDFDSAVGHQLAFLRDALDG